MTEAAPVQASAKPSNSAAPPPPAVVQAWRLAAAVASDGWRFWRHSFTRGARDREQLRARMAMDLHFLEYGMALRHARPGHGFDKAARLLADLETALGRGHADAQTEIAGRVLEAWLGLNAGDPRAAALRPRLETLVRAATGLRGGAETVTRDGIVAATRPVDFAAFLEARHSIRQYAPGPVPPEALERAARAAQQAPTSCNRQTCRIHAWTDPALIARVAALQSGNRGFGHELGGLAVLWTDLRDWTEASERSNGLVDGGMFAMTFLLALHAEGLGTVPLNWSEEPAQDRALRRLARLPDSAQVIVMVGFGLLPETLRVPVSQRRPLDTCLSVNPGLAPA